jgi:hypothetical protein
MTSLNCGYQQVYCSYPRYMSMDRHSGVMSGVIFRFFHQSSLAMLSTELSSSEVVGIDKINYEFFLRSSTFILRIVFLTCLKIVLRGAYCFISPSKEVVLRIFIVNKNPSPSAGFEPANLGSNIKYTNH